CGDDFFSLIWPPAFISMQHKSPNLYVWCQVWRVRVKGSSLACRKRLPLATKRLMEPRLRRITRIKKLRILRIRSIRVIRDCCFLGALGRLVANSYDIAGIGDNHESGGSRPDL